MAESSFNKTENIVNTLIQNSKISLCKVATKEIGIDPNKSQISTKNTSNQIICFIKKKLPEQISEKGTSINENGLQCKIPYYIQNSNFNPRKEHF